MVVSPGATHGRGSGRPFPPSSVGTVPGREGLQRKGRPQLRSWERSRVEQSTDRHRGGCRRETDVSSAKDWDTTQHSPPAVVPVRGGAQTCTTWDLPPGDLTSGTEARGRGAHTDQDGPSLVNIHDTRHLRETTTRCDKDREKLEADN